MKKTSDKYEGIEWNAFVSRLHKPIKCKPKKYYDSKKIFKKHSPPPPKKTTQKTLTHADWLNQDSSPVTPYVVPTQIKEFQRQIGCCKVQQQVRTTNDNNIRHALIWAHVVFGTDRSFKRMVYLLLVRFPFLLRHQLNFQRDLNVR